MELLNKYICTRVMLGSKTSQFSLSAKGEILWQEKLNNPLPGVEVGSLKKGDNALRPVICVSDNEHTAKYDKSEVENSLKLWFKTHLSEVLEPLVLLETPQGVEVKEDAVSKIALHVYKGLGIVPREELEELIVELTPETRADLRAKKIRLGPVLAFIPVLNKPAAVKLRALLWSLYNDAPLPASLPADGIVSVKIEDKEASPLYYRSIGYPLYGGRAVRIDMLDRVISCVYDNADKGKFQARHEMAEWLGCSIEELYNVLEAMGHTKVYDPADEKKEAEETEASTKPVEEVAVTADEPKAVEESSAEKPVETSGDSEEKVAPAKQDVKPELATFRLKKGKAFEKGGSKQGGKKFKPSDAKSDKKGKPSRPQKGHKKGQKDKGPRVISVEAKSNEADSPFAILQQLKK